LSRALESGKSIHNVGVERRRVTSLL
jgi:hypothetical protein